MLVHGGGVIVNCSSIASTMALGGLALYAAAKAGVPVQTTPLIAANGSSRADSSFKLAPDMAKALTAFLTSPK